MQIRAAMFAIIALLSGCGWTQEPAPPLDGVAAALREPTSPPVKSCPPLALEGETAATGELDLDADGKQDAWFLLKEPSGDSTNMFDVRRPLVIALRDERGCLRFARQNLAMIPCQQCGGLSGDPFAGVHMEAPGTFKVAIEGGSRERWYSRYTFTYSRELSDWTLSRVQRGAYDPVEDKEKSIDLSERDLSERDLGRVTFESFDPATVQEVSLP